MDRTNLSVTADDTGTRKSSLTARVRRGAELLDRVRPGWWKLIADDQLAMMTCNRCILGQVYGSYFDGTEAIAAAIRFDPQPWLFVASDHGFTLPEDVQRAAWNRESDPGWGRLANAWRSEVRRRSRKAKAAVRRAGS